MRQEPYIDERIDSLILDADEPIQDYATTDYAIAANIADCIRQRKAELSKQGYVESYAIKAVVNKHGMVRVEEKVTIKNVNNFSI